MQITDEKTFVEKLEVPINGAERASIEFSPDGRFLALLIEDEKDTNRLTIYEVPEDGLESLITDFNDKDTFQDFTYDENIE